MANEFRDTIIPCAYNNLIPNFLPQYLDTAHQSCAGIAGAEPGATFVTGEAYLASLSYSASNIWRNVGILFAWWIFFLGMTIFFTLRWNDAAGSGGALLIPRENQKKVTRLVAPADEEAQANEKRPQIMNTTDNEDEVETNLVRNTSIFTWRNLSYIVKTPSGDRTLLDNISGFVKPGMLGALMGSSGAGKTTLLDVLAQRVGSFQCNHYAVTKLGRKPRALFAERFS